MTRLYALDPAMPVLLRPDGVVQVGWDPRRAVLIRPPRGLTAVGLAALLRSMQSRIGMDQIRHEAQQHGLTDTDALTALIRRLVDAGVASTARRQRRTRSASIRVHGRGPLSDLLVEALRCSGARITHTSAPHAAVTAATADLVMLTDYLVADPRIVRDLHTERVPHLPVRIRDGAGLVGPLVLPGVTSCLGCADLHRGDRDSAWPAVAAQLRDTVGSADRATVLATAALALSQVTRVIGAVQAAEGAPIPGPPTTLDITLELDVNSGSVVTRRWTRHPLCPC